MGRIDKRLLQNVELRQSLERSQGTRKAGVRKESVPDLEDNQRKGRVRSWSVRHEELAAKGRVCQIVNV